jgi:hypothetical protein
VEVKSIITKDLTVCAECGTSINVEKHHCIHGIAGRKLATRYHLIVGLCSECHRGTNGVHGKNGHELDMKYKRLAQQAWEKKYGDREKFIEVFGKSYL